MYNKKYAHYPIFLEPSNGFQDRFSSGGFSSFIFSSAFFHRRIFAQTCFRLAIFRLALFSSLRSFVSYFSYVFFPSNVRQCTFLSRIFSSIHFVFSIFSFFLLRSFRLHKSSVLRSPYIMAFQPSRHVQVLKYKSK